VIQVELGGRISTKTSMHTGQKGIPTLELNHCTGQVQWKHFGPDEATWEMEDAMKHAYPILFTPVHACQVDR
jgi:hypothetical protein